MIIALLNTVTSIGDCSGISVIFRARGKLPKPKVLSGLEPQRPVSGLSVRVEISPVLVTDVCWRLYGQIL